MSVAFLSSLPSIPSLTGREAAYYTQRTEDHLGTIDDIPVLRDIVVPPGYFLSNADIRSNKPVDTESYNTQRAYNPAYQASRPPHQTPSPDSHHPTHPSPYSRASSVSVS